MKIKMNSPSSGENLFKKRHVKSIFLLYVFMVKFKLFRDDIGVMYMMCSRIWLHAHVAQNAKEEIMLNGLKEHPNIISY